MSMKEDVFVQRWEKKRKKGIVIYLTEYMLAVPSGGFIGKVLSDYFIDGIIFKPLVIQDWVSLVFLCLVGILIGLFTWKRLEGRYEKNTKRHDKMA